METLTTMRYKIDIDKINELAVDAAFGENRIKVNEQGLSPFALEAKKSSIAIQEAAKLFVRAALKDILVRHGIVTSGQRRYVEQIAIDAIARGGDCNDYLRGFCEGGGVC